MTARLLGVWCASLALMGAPVGAGDCHTECQAITACPDGCVAGGSQFGDAAFAGPAVLSDTSISSRELLSLAGLLPAGLSPEDAEDLPAPDGSTIGDLPETRNPDAGLFFYSRGYSRFWDGDYQGAFNDLERSAEYNARDARVWYYKGLAQLSLGDQDGGHLSLARGLKAESMRAPPQRLISGALTRVQGPLRMTLEEARRSLPR